MISKSFDKALRALVRRAPFKPFTVELVSGDRIEVHHPEALVYRSGLAVYFSPDGQPVIFDHEGVSQIIGWRTARGKPGNGASKESPPPP